VCGGTRIDKLKTDPDRLGETKSETMRTILLFTISIGIETLLSAQAAALNGTGDNGKKRRKHEIRQLAGKPKNSGRSS
jgi:hypothetical protein